MKRAARTRYYGTLLMPPPRIFIIPSTFPRAGGVHVTVIPLRISSITHEDT